MARDDVTKMQSLLRQLRTASTLLSSATHDVHEFTTSFVTNTRAVVLTTDFNHEPTPAEYAEWFGELAKLHSVNPHWSSIQHHCEIDEDDYDYTYTLYADARMENVYDSPIYHNLHQEIDRHRTRIGEIEEEIVDIVRQNQNPSSNNTVATSMTSTDDEKYWSRHTMSRED